MTATQAKTVSISKAARAIKSDKETIPQVTLAKGLAASKGGKRQVSKKALTAMVTPSANDEDKDLELVFLLGKYTVEAHFLDDVEGQLIDIYPSLLEEADYSPAEIVGETFWANLTNLGQRIAILCLKHLATEPDVPLVDVTCECCGKTSFQVV